MFIIFSQYMLLYAPFRILRGCFINGKCKKENQLIPHNVIYIEGAIDRLYQTEGNIIQNKKILQYSQ